MVKLLFHPKTTDLSFVSYCLSKSGFFFTKQKLTISNFLARSGNTALLHSVSTPSLRPRILMPCQPQKRSQSLGEHLFGEVFSPLLAANTSTSSSFLFLISKGDTVIGGGGGREEKQISEGVGPQGESVFFPSSRPPPPPPPLSPVG